MSMYGMEGIAAPSTADDPLFSKYLPIVRGHIIKKYWWIEQRGNCLLTVDDLIQVASIALVNLTAKWDDMLEEQGKSRDGDGRLFWWYLKNDVKWAVQHVIKRDAKLDADNNQTRVHYDALEEESWDTEVRTSLTRGQDPSLLQRDIVEYFTLMPPREKIILALRYFDELSWPQVSQLLDMKTKMLSEHASKAIERWRIHARNQLLDTPEYLPQHPRISWEPPQALQDYLQNRHRKDIHEYLGYVTICFRVDVAYMVDILGRRSFEGIEDRPSVLSPFQKMQIETLYGSGMNVMDISRELGVTYGSANYHLKRRRAAA